VWQDLPTNWFTVKAWRGLAENVAASVRRGDAVVVTGRFTADVWEREGERSVRSTVVATSIGHDLTRGTSVFAKSVRSEASPEAEEDDVRRVIHSYAETGPNLDSQGNEISGVDTGAAAHEVAAMPSAGSPSQPKAS
jgi:single-strand DNA-binding protein